jgi:antitoxin FitA
MSVSVTIRLPEETRDELMARAAAAGQSLQDYLRGLLTALVGDPAPSPYWSRVQARVERTGSRLTAEQILAARDVDRA